MEISIDKIRIGQRTRKNNGDIAALAQSISDIGLLHPIVIDKDNNLIAGQRRIEAHKHLGRRVIEARIVDNLRDAYELIKAERDENVCRMDFRPTEAVAMAEVLEPLERAAAAARQRAGINQYTEPSVNFTEGSKGKAVDKVAASVGMSAPTLKKAKEVIEAAEAEPDLFGDLVNKMDEENKVDPIYKEMHRRQKEQRAIEETKKQTANPALIIHEDCYALADSVDPIDLLIADPPYFTDGDFTEYISLYLARVKETGQAYVFCSADPEELSAYLNIETYKMNLEQILVWNYNNTGQRQPNKRYTSNYQLCLYYRGQDAPDIIKPSDGKNQYACQTVNAPDGRLGDRYHEWQKPYELIERFILNSSKPGDFVFDPFAGTGTTLIAAAKNGRRAMGCELEEQAVDVCVKRGCVRGV